MNSTLGATVAISALRTRVPLSGASENARNEPPMIASANRFTTSALLRRTREGLFPVDLSVTLPTLFES